jgi:hypothetical protein
MGEGLPAAANPGFAVRFDRMIVDCILDIY